jgi:hypothetical protein
VLNTTQRLGAIPWGLDLLPRERRICGFGFQTRQHRPAAIFEAVGEHPAVSDGLSFAKAKIEIKLDEHENNFRSLRDMSHSAFCAG